MPDKLTIYEIKEKIERIAPNLILGWNTETGRPTIVSKGSRVLAYPYHQKWIVTPYVSRFVPYVDEIIDILGRWDGGRG